MFTVFRSYHRFVTILSKLFHLSRALRQSVVSRDYSVLHFQKSTDIFVHFSQIDGYNIEIILIVPLDEFEEFKRHSLAGRHTSNGRSKEKPKQGAVAQGKKLVQQPLVEFSVQKISTLYLTEKMRFQLSTLQFEAVPDTNNCELFHIRHLLSLKKPDRGFSHIYFHPLALGSSISAAE